MLIDDIKIKVNAGRGGDGLVTFSKEKMSLGPTGGNGGNGGNVCLEGMSDIGGLNQFRYQKEFFSGDGRTGKRNRGDGEMGKDLCLKIPVGTVIHNLTTEKEEEIVKVSQKIIIAKGGKGGRGNFSFRSSTNTSPREFGLGVPGESFELRLELKLIADVGLVGLPNAGKSSLLNELTGAKSKVGNYRFTTLNPHLGTYGELILSDIPGLIEGASSGKGLGIKFLRHIERTKFIFHLVSAESQKPHQDYEAVRKEMGSYNKELLEKPEYILITKSDLVTQEELNEKIQEFKNHSLDVLPVSIYDYEKMQKIKELLGKINEVK